jgi:putative ABC transport system permease protein
MSFQGFIWKNEMRNKRRTILTMLSVALALFVVATLVTFVTEVDRNLEETSPLRLITRHAVSLANVLPERYRAQIERVPGVVAVTPYSWYGGLYIDEAHTDFAQFACDPKTLFDVNLEISLPPEQKQAFMKERTAAIVGRRKAEKHGWKLGDRITLKGVIYPVDLELTIRGIFTGTLNSEAVVYFNRDYLEEGMHRPGIVGTYWIRVDSIDSIPRVIDAIDAMSQSSDAPTKTETEKAFTMSFIAMLGNLKGLIATISSVIIFTILLVTANTMAMSVRERTREIAVLKALGVRPRTVLGLIVSEGVLITIIGGLAGCLGARLAFRSLDLAAFSQGFFQQLDVTWGTIALGFLLSALVGLLSTAVPAYYASKLTVVDGLRHVG